MSGRRIGPAACSVVLMLLLLLASRAPGPASAHTAVGTLSSSPV